DSPFIRLLDEADASYDFLGNRGGIFYFQTNLNAPRGRIIAIDTEHPERANWQELVPEQQDVITSTLIANNQFVVVLLHDAHHQIKVYNLDGSFARDIELPTLGSLLEISGKPNETELFINFTSFLYPPTIYRYDFVTRALSLLHSPEMKFDATNYETKQVFYTSKDGTRIPMFLTHR